MSWTTEQQALATASLESWHGTPYVNRIAIKGIGIDCVNLVYEVLIASGWLPRTRLGAYNISSGLYEPSDWLKNVWLTGCNCHEESLDAPEFGDIVIFLTGKNTAHCGIYTPGFVWHSLAKRGVLKTAWPHWRHRAESLIRLDQPGFRVQPQTAIRLCQEKQAASAASS